MAATTKRRRICFVTGTRAEFGLMRTTLEAIAAHRKLHLQIVVTGMHLDRRRGQTLRQIEADGWSIDYVSPWRRGNRAIATGSAMADLGQSFEKLDPHVVLVVGD